MILSPAIVSKGGELIKFKPISKHCPECKKFLFITSADQKEVECTYCKSKFRVLRNGVKLEKI